MIVSERGGTAKFDFVNSVLRTNGPLCFGSSAIFILQLPIYAVLAAISMEMSSGLNKSLSIRILAFKPSTGYSACSTEA